MTLQSAALVTAPTAFRLRSCPHCDEPVVAPDMSEFVSDGKVRHFWSCDSCGHEFRTAVRVRIPEAA